LALQDTLWKESFPISDKSYRLSRVLQFHCYQMLKGVFTKASCTCCCAAAVVTAESKVQPWFAAAVKFYLAFANFYCQL
jgi:hypothetical protein